MKKIFIMMMIFFIIGCSNNNLNSTSANNYTDIPVKNELKGVSIEASSVNTKNIDHYLFRDDVIYVDLRPYSWVLRDGHIAGFQFFPFYDFMAHLNYTDRLFKMNGSVGTIGCFAPNYVESEQILNNFFSKDKYIFAISQSGLECTYFFNLLIQYDYDAAKLYNIGGFAIGTGLKNVAYINTENPKYLVKGNNMLSNENLTLDFMKELTPIE